MSSLLIQHPSRRLCPGEGAKALLRFEPPSTLRTCCPWCDKPAAATRRVVDGRFEYRVLPHVAEV